MPVSVQPIRRSGTMRTASRQRPQRRWLGGRAEAGRHAIQGEGLTCEFHLSGRKLAEATPGHRQGRMASGRILSACRLHSNQWRDLPRMSSPSTTSVGPVSNGSRKEKARSSGRGCRAVPLRSAYSFMHWPTISVISCAHWRRRSRSKTGR